jgi:hypothetical protein
LTMYTGLGDLFQSLENIRMDCSDSSVPLVIWDEFDRQLQERELGWLEMFLVPTWDRKYLHNGITRELGKVIFVFTGGVFSTYGAFVEEVRRQPAGTKTSDFLTRLSHKIDLLSINYGELETQNTTLIRRSVILRSLLERLAPHLINPRGELAMDSGVIWALLKINEFAAGSRSLENIIRSSNVFDRQYFGQALLPTDDILSMHVSPRFGWLLIEEPDTDITAPLLSCLRWPLDPRVVA